MSKRSSRTSDQFIWLVSEKKTEAVNAYLIKNSQGEGGGGGGDKQKTKRERELWSKNDCFIKSHLLHVIVMPTLFQALDTKTS